MTVNILRGIGLSIALLASLLVTSTRLEAAIPSLQWSQSISDTGFGRGKTLVVLSDGDYVAGTQIGPSSARDIRLTRHHRDTGAILWTRNINLGNGDDINDMVVDGADNVYIAARASVALQFLNWFVVKINAAGAEQWRYTYNDPANQNDECYTLALTSDGNVVAVGQTLTSTNFFGRAAKINAATGNEIWAHTTSTIFTSFSHVAADSSGNAYVVGQIQAVAIEDYNAQVLKFGPSNGTPLWDVVINNLDNGFDGFNHIALDATQQPIIAGSVRTRSSTTDNNIGIVKLAATNGTVQWRQTISGAAGASDTVADLKANSNGIFLAGQIRDVSTDMQGLVAKLNTGDGSVAWTFKKNGPVANANDRYRTVEFFNNQAYAVGVTTNSGSTDVWLSKLSAAAGAEQWTVIYDTPTNLPDEYFGTKHQAVVTADDIVTLVSEVTTPASGNVLRFAPAAAVAPTVSSPTSTAVTINSATLGGNVTSDGGAAVSVRGIVLSPTAANNNPLIGGGGVTNLTTTGTTGVFTLNAGSLTANTAYSFKAYATNSVGTGYSSVGTFTTVAPSLTINNVAANEGDTGITNFTFTVSLSAPAGPGGVSFNISTANDTAAAGSDYVASSLSSQTIPAGVSSYNFTVQVNGDAFNEANETFFVNVSSVTGATVGDGQGVGTITNDDPLPNFSINDVSVTEGNVGTTLAQFTVTLSRPSGQTVAVSYATANGTAIAGADYASNIGTLNFSPGETTRPVTVQVQGDALVEANETYFVNLSGQVNAAIIDNQGLGTIVDDDCPSTVVSSGADSGAGTLRQVIADACAGSTITFAPGVNTVTLTTAELSGNKPLTIDGGSGVTITRSTAVGTPDFRILYFSGVNLSLSNLTFSNGVGSDFGGGVRLDSGNLTLTDSVVRNNRLTDLGGGGHGVFVAFGNLTMTRTLVEGNQGAFGSVMVEQGAATIVESTIRNNAGSHAGIRFLTPIGASSITNSTISGNTGVFGPAGIGVFGLAAALSVSSTTISGNQSGSAAIAGSTGLVVTLRNSIVSGNSLADGSPADSTLAFGTGSINNLIGTGGGLTNGTDGNIVGVNNPRVSTTGDFGGPLPTAALLPGSPAINAGTATGAPTTDQRGIARVGAVDIGAFESRGFTLAISGGNSQSALIGAAFTSPLAVTVTPVSAGEPVQGGLVTYTSPGAGASASLATSPATINASGVASVTATANTTIGSYAVAANANGNSGAALSFALQNLAPGLSINDVSQAEGTGGSSTFTFTVSLSAPAGAGGVSFDIATANGTASSGSDYVASSLTGQSIAAGNSSRTFVVTVNGDTTFEANETFFVNVTSVTGAVVTDGQGLGTINNDDVAPTLTINAPSVTEGNPPTSPSLNFVVSLSEPSGLPVSFSFATNGLAGTATAGADYVAIGGTAGTIAPGRIGATVNVAIIGDTTPEPNETIVLNLTGISGATPASLTGTGTINDDDVTTVVIGDASLTEGDSGTQILIFNVDRNSSAGAFTVDFVTSSGTATAGSDYTVATGTLTFPAGGSPRETVVVTTIGDLSVEANETFSVTLSNLVNSSQTASITDNRGVGTINDNDSATVQFNPVTLSQSEATSSMAFAVTLSNPVQSGVTLTVNSTPGTATSPADFTAISGGTVSFPPNTTTAQTVNVAINNDSLFEGNETYTLALSNLVATGNVTLPPGTATATGTINNDDDAPTITISAPSVTEGNPPTNPSLNFVVSLNTASGLPVSFSFATNGPAGTATAGADYTAITSGFVNIGPGELSATLPVTVLSDTISEGNETVVLALSGISNANVTTLSGTGTINDDDVARIAITDAGLTEGDSGSQNLQFTVTRSGNGGAFSVDFATSDATATAGSDYTSTTGTLNFTTNGAPSQVINVPITGESLVEVAETLTVTLSNVVNTLGTAAIDDGSGTGTISDNDSATVQFAPTSVSQSEATSPIAFTVTLSNPVQSGVTVTVNSAPSTAASPADFTAISNQTVSFAPNSTASQTVNVTIANDALDENDETFTLALSGLTATGNVTLPAGTATATGTILDDDAAPVLSVANVSQPEGNASNTLIFTLSLSAVSGLTVSATRATTDDTAVSSGPTPDFVALGSAPISIPAGQTSLTIPVTINGDTVFEGDESFSLNLTSVSNATPGNVTATGTLTDDDQQPTNTTITADLPDPSVVGQPYPVAVEVRAQTLPPLGTVSIIDGTGASCSAPLTAGTGALSTMTCTLTSTTAGNKTLTATYAPANTAFGASSDTESHRVDPAATTLTLVGPATVRFNTPASYTATLAVSAPGAGTPAGTVTVSSGAQSCTITLPTATPSCTLSFPTLGTRTVNATFVPSNGDFLGASASPIQTLAFASTDLVVTKDNGITSYQPNDLLVYTVEVENRGPDGAPGVRILDPVPAGLTNVAWTCVAQAGAICPSAGGAGGLDMVVQTMPSGSRLVFTYYGNVQGSAPEIVNIARAELPANGTLNDPAPGNETATDIDRLNQLHTDGFEPQPVNAPAGAVQLPVIEQRAIGGRVAWPLLDLRDRTGLAVRVYVRTFDDALEYALATRGSDDRLRLGPWQRYPVTPTLRWTAVEDRGSWRVTSARLD